MTLTLAQLRARKTKPKELREWDVEVCLDHALQSDLDRLSEELAELQAAAKGAPKRKMAQGADPREAELAAEIERVQSAMRETTGKLTLRTIEAGEWIRWKDENPPREGIPSDQRLCYGLVSSTALISDLGRWVVAWDGEPLEDDDWAGWLSGQLAPGDLADCANAVVMHQEERSTILPKSMTVSSSTPSTSSD